MFKVTIYTDSAAFDDRPTEVARVLRQIAYELENGLDDFSKNRTLRDYNGNDCGRAVFTPDE